MGYPEWLQPGPVEARPPRLAGGAVLQYRSLTVKEGDEGAVVLLPNAAGGHVALLPYTGGTGPAVKRPETYTIEMNAADDEEGYYEMARLARLPTLAELFLGWPLEDIFVATDEQTAFSPSRSFPYGDVFGSSVNTTDFPVRAWLNGTAQTMVYGAAPAPSAGEVGILTAARAQHLAIVTPALEAGDVLLVRSYRLQEFRVTRSWGHPRVGELTTSYDLTEALRGRWD